MAVRRLVDAIGQSEVLEEPAARLADAVRGWFAPRTVKNALSGVWLGHRLHPLLTDAVIGAWASAGLLDLLGNRHDRGAARRLVGAGLVAAVPTAAAGLSDYSDLYDHGRRVAFLHALAADLATLLQVASLWTRRRDNDTVGRLLRDGRVQLRGPR